MCVVRPEKIRDPKTKEVVKVLSPKQRGALLLKRLGISGAKAKKFVFVDGDIEQPHLGIADGELKRLERSITHVVHCAASVSFDDAYENSFRANVQGARNALEFALSLQNAKGSKFIQHIAIETSYIHGRKKRTTAQESALVFPRNFYNNFYELTKAMASLETDYTLIERGLRVAQLLPSIVIGHSKTGNNRGDTKVVNAPINAFGRSKEALDSLQSDAVGRGKAWLIGSIAAAFPGDRSAELNIVPVDRVVEGILAALTVPESIGERIHLATDNRIRSEDIARITREEIGIDVRLADPTLFRNVTLPVVKAVLERSGEPKLANALDKLGTIFGGYGEWGQPIHDVGNDVRILGLSAPAPEHRERVPDALPAQQVRAGVRQGPRPRRDRAPRAPLGEDAQGDGAQDRPPGRVDPARRVPPLPLPAPRAEGVQGEREVATRLSPVVALREEARREREVEVGDEEALLAVGLEREERPVGLHDRRRRRGALGCVVHRRDPDRVLGRAAEERLLVERVRRVRERRRRVAARPAQLEVRVEDDLRAVARRPSHRLGIPPALVADRDAERERPDREHAPRGPRRVRLVLARVELHLVLEAQTRAVGPDHERGREERLALEALRSENDADPAFAAATATRVHARSRNAASGGGGVLPSPR